MQYGPNNGTKFIIDNYYGKIFEAAGADDTFSPATPMTAKASGVVCRHRLMVKQRFNYDREYKNYNDYAYYGFHRRHGRFSIDTKRLKKLNYQNVFPEELFSTPRNTHYFVPKYKHIQDYGVNKLKTILNKLKKDWENEYSDFIKSIKTPGQVYENVRLNEIMVTSCSDDIDEIEVDARMAAYRYVTKYNELISSIHLQYLQKIFAEFLRTIYLVIKDRGLNSTWDFEAGYLYSYVQNRFPDGDNPIYSLKHHKYFDALNKIVNFLKHNTRRSYEFLVDNPKEKDVNHKKFLASFAYSKADTGVEYESGMYAGDWIKIDAKTVSEMLSNLILFSEELCQLLYDEDPKEASWNSDEYLLGVLCDEIIYIV